MNLQTKDPVHPFQPLLLSLARSAKAAVLTLQAVLLGPVWGKANVLALIIWGFL